MSAIFWCSAFVLFYIFIGYPLLLVIWAKLRGDTRRNMYRHQAGIKNTKAPGFSSTTSSYEPDISILIIAYNEQASIRQKLTNLLALHYQKEKLQIVVVSDASTDATDKIVTEFAAQGVLLKKSSIQSGKPANLNTFIPQLSGEIIVLMDARQSVDLDCLLHIVKNFKDPDIGAVSGELHLAPAMSATSQEAGIASGAGFYWRYEKLIRRMESQIDSSVGATGAIYAIRKNLFITIKNDTLLDDLLIPMNIVRQGYRVVFEPMATAIDTAAVTTLSEFGRKVRTIAGNFQLLSRELWMINPVTNRIWLQTISHKLLRLTAPVFIITLLVSNAFLLDQNIFKWIMFFQIAFYCLALAGMWSGTRWQRNKAFAIPYAFCVLNMATVIGFLRFILRQQQISWKR